MAQTRYIAVYETRITFNIDLSGIKLEYKKQFRLNKDSAIAKKEDSLVTHMDTALLKSMILQMFDESAITVYIRFDGDSVSATLEYDYAGAGNINPSNDQAVEYIEGRWKRYSKTTGEVQDQQLLKATDFIATGKEKYIQDHKCYEAVATDTAGKTIIWVCKELPESISPGITVQGIGGAILEFSKPFAASHVFLVSIKKYNKL